MLHKEKLISLCFAEESGQYGVPYSAEEFDKNKYRYLRISDISDDGHLLDDDLKSVSGDNLENYLLSENDIVFARTGNSTGRSYLYDKRHGKLVYAGFLIRYKIDGSKINPKYIHYFTHSNYYKKWVENLSNGSTRGNINAQTFADCNILYPDKSQQDILVNTLTSIDEKIALNNRLNAELEAMAKQLYDYWFVQFDFPDENGKPYKSSGGKMVYNSTLKREIPAGWEVSHLKELLTLEDSRRIPLSNKERENRKGKYPYYGATGIMDYIDDYIFDGDYILLAEDGSTSDENGNPVVQYIWGKNWVNNHAHIIHVEDDTQLQYYYFLLKTIPVVLIETGSIQKKISQENLLAYSVVCPPETLRREYCSISSSYRNMQKMLVNEINHLTHFRDSLLPMLMNGQVTVE